MYKVLVLFALFSLFGCANVLHTVNSSSDEPDYPRDSTVSFKAAGSYEQALQVWKTPEDINAWIAANFLYDTARALRLSGTQRTKNEHLSIYHPSEFFESKSGVCVDRHALALRRSAESIRIEIRGI
jgi:hypothetical protein